MSAVTRTVIFSVVVMTLLLCTRCHGYRYFQDRVPNGEAVPHPCRPGETWPAIGHERAMGGGPRNPFGLDFQANGKKWDRTLCLKDSDRDGLSNGSELGDPDCEWKPGTRPTRTVGISHPGVCDIWTAPHCKEFTRFVQCADTVLDCPAINEPDTSNITILFAENTTVPTREESYGCMGFEFPQDADYHMVAYQPLLDNLDAVHYMAIFACETNETLHPLYEMYECGVEVDKHCPHVIATWDVASVGACANPEMGFRVGQTGFKWGVIQVHWLNHMLRDDFTDRSGMTLHLTSNLRRYDAGIMKVGQDFLFIPPREPSVTVTGECSSDCSRRLVKDDVKVIGLVNHMRSLGVSQRVVQVRDAAMIRDIQYDPNYQYTSPQLHTFENPLTLRPGDVIRTECIYNSMARSMTTFAGDVITDETCYAYITYYPKENIPNPQCTAWKDVTLCAFNISDVIDGCRFGDVHDLSAPIMNATYVTVMENCSPYAGCRKECLPVVRNIKQTACYREGTMNDWGRMNVDAITSVDVKMKLMKFYSALDSCDHQLRWDINQLQCPEPGIGVESSGCLEPSTPSISSKMTSLIASVVLVLARRL